MDLGTRKLVDRYFTAFGVVSILLMTASLVVLLGPIAQKGIGAYIFRGTIEWRRMVLNEFGRGDEEALAREMTLTGKARQPVYDMLETFRADMKDMDSADRREYRASLDELEDCVTKLLGPAPGTDEGVLPRQKYGATRWDRAQMLIHDVLYYVEWVPSETGGMMEQTFRPRVDLFRGTSLEPLFTYIEEHTDEMLRPERTFYWRFLTDDSVDAHIFGGIWPEVLGTVYLTLGAMLFAVPMGVIAAIYLVEYARESLLLSFLRTCISTLAGVPSIVFGLFGLAFFVNTLRVSPSKSVLAGSLTLALLVLPTVIRASEEAIRAVPTTYREAALSLGASKWRMVLTVVLPAALPGILTSIVISMGRAAGETAPIIFTAAVSVGQSLSPLEVFDNPTPALPWNIYNLATEHEAVDEIRHVQFGMVLTLIALVLLLNMTAIILRARITKKLKG
ncbi:MAG: phosphate ABC transporter permease PstA [Candidatus Hydrogenedentota bacterium]